MKNKFSLIGLLINIIIFIFFSSQFFGISILPTGVSNMTGYFLIIIGDIVAFLLWWLIRLGRKINESKLLHLINFALAVFNSLWLIINSFLILMLLIGGR